MKQSITSNPQDNVMWDTWMTMWRLATVTAADEIGFFEQFFFPEVLNFCLVFGSTSGLWPEAATRAT